MIRSPQLIFYMAGRISCTCGCGREVTYATKRNHLNARGKTSLRARVMTETRSLKKIAWQQQNPTPLLQNSKGLKNRASSDPDQNGSRKRRKVAQLEENQLPENFANSQVDTEDLFPPAAADTDRQGRFIERSRGVMEIRWTTSGRDGSSHSDGKGDDNGGGDDEDDKDKDDEDKDDEDKDDEDKDDEDKDDEDKDDEDKDDEDKDDEDEPLFHDSEIPGISNWDLIGEDFEREAASLGLYFLYELPTHLTTL
jgi:hypothetical protein